MKKEISTQITINASPEKVWSILTDFAQYPTWNPFIRSITGDVKTGNQIRVEIEPPDGKMMVFKPTVIQKTENEALRWLGKLFIGGLFDGEHHFVLKQNTNGTTTFFHAEYFSGILVRWINLEKTKIGFERMNQQLKKLAEQ